MQTVKECYKMYLHRDVEFVRDMLPEEALSDLAINATDYRVPDPQNPRLASEALMKIYKTKKYPQHKHGDLTQKTKEICTYLGLAPGETTPVTVHHTTDFPSEDSTSCSDAEPCFVDAKKVATYQTRETDQSVNIFHTPAHTPLLFGKEVYARTSLTLQPMVAEELYIPRGTIVATARDMSQHTTGMRVTGKSSVLETFAVDGPPRVAPLRLSPWAFDDEENRSLYALTPTDWGNGTTVDTLRFSQIHEATIAEFTRVAHALVQEVVEL